MQTKRLMLDVDGVLADSQQHLITHLNEQGFQVSLNDISAYNWGNLLQKTQYSPEYLINLINELWSTDWANIPPIHDNIGEIYQQLCTMYGEVHVVTANPTDTVPKWLAKYGIRDKFLHHKGDKTDLGFCVYVEDNPYIRPPEHAQLIIYNRPWNQSVTVPHERIYCLTELIQRK
jgi:phosphoglycolate phosphatase-like HAD superfamily hydrolase